jgi:phage recombination protein Bet
MANSLVKQNADKVVAYECNGSTVKLTPNIIRQYLVSGGGDVTDQEIVMFLNLCRYQRLNPFLREAYLIKFGNNPASMVTGKEVFTKRANRNKDYAGQQAGVVVQNATGAIENRIGALVLDKREIVGGWAKVYIKNYDVPIEISIGLSEYIGMKKDGEINQQWSKKPAT